MIFAFAVPAYKNTIELIQPDGSKIQARIHGDEFYHWFEDTEGYTILKNPSLKNWVYAQKDSNGRLVPSSHEAGKILPSSLQIKKSIRDDEAFAKGRQRATDMYKTYSSGSLSKTSYLGIQKAPATGSKGNLVILVNFSDKSFTIPQSSFEDLFNATSYTTDGAKGSVKAYFNEVSYGKFTFDSVVTAVVTVSKRIQLLRTKLYGSRRI